MWPRSRERGNVAIVRVAAGDYGVLQCGRAHVSAETRIARRCHVSCHQASMWPRSRERGNMRLSPDAIAQTECFNVAALT